MRMRWSMVGQLLAEIAVLQFVMIFGKKVRSSPAEGSVYVFRGTEFTI